MYIELKELLPTELLRNEALFHVANGYVGVRGNFEEGCPAGQPTVRGTYVNAFYDDVPIKYGERLYGFPTTGQRMLNVTDTQGMEISFGKEKLDPFGPGLMSFARRLDMQNGYALRRVRQRMENGEVEVLFRRMASFACPQLVLFEAEITSLSYAGGVAVISTQEGEVFNFADESDPRVASERAQNLFVRKVWENETGSFVLSETARSGLSLASAVAHRAQGLSFEGCQTTATGAKHAFGGRLEPGQTVRLEKYCIFTDSRRFSEPAAQAEALLNEALKAGAALWRERQRQYLDRFWEKSRVHILGDAALQNGMDFCLYQLLQSAGRDEVSNISAKGLSGEGYEGHYFWDTEIYMFPFFLLTDPAAAKSLIRYRCNTLDGARAHARAMGHMRGALYPWRTIAGSECSSYFPSGSAQYHINGDVAHSFLSYYYVTGDLAFMAEQGAEVLVETARLWLDVGHYDDAGRFCIDCVTGPDEYTCIVNNNYFTNAGAKENLLGAAYICRVLKEGGLFSPLAAKLGLTESELEAFERAANSMYFPYDEKLGIHAQDDSFLKKAKWKENGETKFPLLLHYHPLYIYRYQVCKQADTILAHYLYDEGLDEGVMSRSFDYYEQVTTHDSSLSCCVFSIMATRLQKWEKAYEYFLETARLDLDDTHDNTRDGIHTANMGGAYLCVVTGFAGLRIRRDGLHFRITLPERWHGYSFRLQYHGSELEVCVKPARTMFTLLSGEPVRLFADERPYVLESTLTIERETRRGVL